MGAEVLAVLKGVEVISGAISGGQKAAAQRDEAAAAREEADLEFGDAIKSADIAKEQGEQFMAQQALGFTASGVKLAGSPLAILEDTQKSITEEFTGRVSRAERVRGLRETRAGRLEKGAEATELGALAKVALGAQAGG